MRARYLWATVVLMSGCAFNRPDHFILLDSGNLRPLAPRGAFSEQVNLHVSLPLLVDRSELVLVNPRGAEILEHERWAAPLDEQFLTALGQDIESRREDVILSSRRIALPEVATINIDLEVVQLYLIKGSAVRLDARWRMADSRGMKSQSRETFMVPVAEGSYLSLTRAFDACIGLLADRLAADLPR